MTEYHLKCPKCRHEFDLNYSQWNSLSDPDSSGSIHRYGPHRFSVPCRSCGKRSTYHVSKEGEIEAAQGDTLLVPLLLLLVLLPSGIAVALLGLVWMPLLVVEAGALVVAVLIYRWTRSMRNEVRERRLPRKRPQEEGVRDSLE